MSSSQSNTFIIDNVSDVTRAIPPSRSNSGPYVASQLKGQSNEILIPFLHIFIGLGLNMNRSNFKIFQKPPRFYNKQGETLGKIIFFRKFFLIAENYFGILFLDNKFILETYLLTIKRFRKAALKLEDLNMTFKRLSKTYLCFRNRFPK
jgi:hypothetical protein